MESAPAIVFETDALKKYILALRTQEMAKEQMRQQLRRLAEQHHAAQIRLAEVRFDAALRDLNQLTNAQLDEIIQQVYNQNQVAQAQNSRRNSRQGKKPRVSRTKLEKMKRVIAPRSPSKYTRGTRLVEAVHGTHHAPTAARRGRIHQQVLMNHHIRAGAAEKAKQRRRTQVGRTLKQNPKLPNNMADYISLFMNNATMYSPRKSPTRRSK